MGYKVTLGLLLCLILFGACSKTPGEAVLSQALEDIKEPLALMDKRFSIYENALTVIGEYIENPSDETLEAAKAVNTTAIAEIAKLPLPVSTLTAEEQSALIKLGVNMADYGVPFQYSGYYKYENIQTLTLLSYYLSGAPSQNEILAYIVDFNTRYQSFDRKLEYIGLNGLFCGFSGDGLEDFKTGFLPDLTAFSADGLPWETDSAVLEAKAEYWFSGIESDIEDYANFVGERYLELLEAQSAYRDIFTGAGYSLEEADAIIEDVDELERIAEDWP